MSGSCRGVIVSSMAAAMLCAMGCVDEQVGEAGRLSFAFGDKLSFETPITVGARAQLSVSRVGSSQVPSRVSVVDVTISDPAILSMAPITSETGVMVGDMDVEAGSLTNSITLEALSEGTTEIVVEAVDFEGRRLTERVTVSTVTPTGASIGERLEELGVFEEVADERCSMYVSSTDELTLPFDVTGRGYGYFPFDIEPAEALTLVGTPGINDVASFTVNAPEPVRFVSQVDDTVVELEFAQLEQIDGVLHAVLGAGDPEIVLRAGGSEIVFMHPLVSQKPLCGVEVEAVVEVSDDTICTVDETSSGATVMTVDALAAGTCTYTISYPGVSGSWTFSLEIAPEP